MKQSKICFSQLKIEVKNILKPWFLTVKLQICSREDPEPLFLLWDIPYPTRPLEFGSSQ